MKDRYKRERLSLLKSNRKGGEKMKDTRIVKPEDDQYILWMEELIRKYDEYIYKSLSHLYLTQNYIKGKEEE